MPSPSLLLLCLLLQAPTTATVPLYLEHDRPFIDIDFVRGDGSLRSARFWVDTGGGGFLLAESLARDLGSKIGTPVEDGGEKFAPIAPPLARVGGMPLDLRDARCLVMIGPSTTFAGVSGEGLLPAHVLRRYHVTFDYPARSFSLAPPPAPPPHGEAIAAPIGAGSGFPRIELEIGGKRLGFLLDTGASFTMISQAQIAMWSREHADWRRTEGAVGRANMMGGAMEARAALLRLPEVKLGAFVLHDVGAVGRPPGTFEQYMSSMMAAPIVGAIGGNVLREFRVEIDYAAERVYLTRSTQPVEPDLDLVGLTLHKVERGYAVDAISPHNDARVVAAIAPGDVLVQVDELDASKATLARVIDALRGAVGDEHTLILERNGKSFECVAPVVHIL